VRGIVSVFKRMVPVAGLVLTLMVRGPLVVGTAQEADPSVEPSSNEGDPLNKWQRSWEVFNLQTTAPAGWQRGEEIYYFKCWMCHNKYAKTGPLLHDLYQRPRLVSGEPVNDKTVAEKIKNGSPGMPAYGHTLSDADLEDLLSYLREKCCFEADEPPQNPRYRH
jgi:cytochrome c5